MPTVTAEDLMWDVPKIADAVRTWNSFDGFTAETCGKCKATANVLGGCPGWFCPCGHYNCQSWNCHTIPHAHPTYGPDRQVILDGVAQGRRNLSKMELVLHG